MRALLILGAIAALLIAELATGDGGTSRLPDRLGVSGGRQYYVDGESGSDRNPGTVARPWRTIRHAWRAVPLAGSVIVVRAGTYTTPTWLTDRAASARTPITIRPFRGETVVLTNTVDVGAAVHIARASGVRVRGFRITNPRSDGVKVTDSADVEIVGNRIYGAGNQGIIVVGSGVGRRPYSHNVQIWGNRIYRNGALGNAAFNHGIYYGASGGDTSASRSGTVGGVIANNVLYDQPTGDLIQVGPRASGLIVTNNTLTGARSVDPNTGTAIGLWGTGDPFTTAGVVVVNNVIAFNANRAIHGSGPSMPSNRVQRNLSFGNRGGDFEALWGTSKLFSLDDSNITGRDPGFMDLTAEDFRPRAGSPLIDRADPAYAPVRDATGQLRSGAPDIGAFEYRR